MDKLENLKLLLNKPENYEYFFRKLDKPNWFNTLKNKLKVFEKIPEPIMIHGDKYLYYPNWWPGLYLVKVADKIPEKVVEVIKGINTENQTALNYALQAMLKMPSKNTVELLPTIDKWFNKEQKQYIEIYSKEIFDKLIKEKNYIGAMALFDLVSKPKRINDESSPRIKSYYFKEIIKKLRELYSKYPKEILEIAEKRLKESLDLEYGGKEKNYDGLTIWRPAIEDSTQNWNFDRYDGLMIEVLRDVLLEYDKNEPNKIKEKINIYLNHKYHIFKRLAIHKIRILNMDDYAKTKLSEKQNLDDYFIHHEYFLLLKTKFNILNENEKNTLVGWIKEGYDITNNIKSYKKMHNGEEPSENDKYAWKNRWIEERLSMIEGFLEETDKKYLDDIRAKIGKSEQPEYSSLRSEWVGPESPKTKEEIEKMKPEEFLNYIKEEFKPKEINLEPSPEGLARIFSEIVKNNPEPYANIADQFNESNIYPTYISALFHGFEGAYKDKKFFNLKKIFILMNKVITILQEPDFVKDKDSSAFGRFEYVRGDISDFIEAIMEKDENIISNEEMQSFKKIVFYIIENDTNPTEENEKKYGPEANNLDFSTFALNCNRGKALLALMQYALRYARFHAKKDKKKNNEPSPPGERIESDVKELINKHLINEKSPSVQSVYGRLLPYLFYLDQEWIKTKLQDGLILPTNEEKNIYWRAQFEGYITFNKFYDQLYSLLKEHYKKAIKSINIDKKGVKESNRHLASHIMIAFWRDLEELNKPDSLVDVFFKKAPEEIKESAISFLSTGLKEEKEIDKKWNKLKSLWTKRIKDSKDSEISGFLYWLKYDLPEPLNKLVNLIKPLIPYVYKLHWQNEFLNFLDKNIEKYPNEVMGLLVNMLEYGKKNSESIYHIEEMQNILIKAKQNSSISELFEKCIYILCKMGYHQFRDLLKP